MTERPRLKVGARLRFRANPEIVRVITEVRASGYTWRYADARPGEDFWSENTSDPFFEMGWEEETD